MKYFFAGLINVLCSVAGASKFGAEAAQYEKSPWPVMAAVEYRDAVALKAILKTGAGRKAIESSVNDGMKQTPLLAAAGSHQYVIAQLLVDAGANTQAKDKFGLSIQDFLGFDRLPLHDPETQARIKLIRTLSHVSKTFDIDVAKKNISKDLGAPGRILTFQSSPNLDAPDIFVISLEIARADHLDHDRNVIMLLVDKPTHARFITDGAQMQSEIEFFRKLRQLK